MTAAESFKRDGLDPEIWRLIDDHRGRTYSSVPIHEPVFWRTETLGKTQGRLVYACGQYRITREPYGKSSWTYRLTRNADQLGVVSFGRLRDAKDHARRNARGMETRHYA